MISIEVTAYEGAPLAGRLAGEFDELGGSIGRTPGNNLVLPDPQRHISRTHAAIVFRAGQYILRDLGSASPVIVNGRALGHGNEAPIGEGDELRIAGYTLRVVAKPSAEARGEAAAAPSGLPHQDPLLALGGVPTASDPFADLIAPPPASARVVRSPPALKSESGAPSTSRPSTARAEGAARQPPLIPEDFDPFAEPSPPAAAASSVLPEDVDLVLGPATGKLDELFDLRGAERAEPFQPGNPLAPPIDDWRSSPVVDPLVALGAVPAAKGAAPAAQRDDTPEIQGMFVLPKRREPAELTPTQAQGPSQPAPDVGPPPNAQAAVSREDVAWVGAAPGTDTERAPAPDTASSAPAGSAPADALWCAFLSGAGLPDTAIPGGLTPPTMKAIGQLLRECTQGTLDLLRARAMTKQQLRAEVTILAARENNPLKFSPTVEAALTHLLAPPSRGFMTPQQATKDAYNDLRAHELGFMAGMRAALAGVLARFRPGQLEQRLSANSVVDALLPSNRKARLWDRFVELYGDLSKEAEDDFQTLFGREFLRAYEAQIAEIEREEAGHRPSS